jgi:hypothetical protein
LLILLQSSLPCSENFYRFKKNYEKFIAQGPKSSENSPKDGSSKSQNLEQQQPQKKQIASPKIIGRMSPINNMIERKGLNFNPKA